MILHNTFNKLYISLFFISFNLSAAEVAENIRAKDNVSCTQALSVGDINQAMRISNEVLKSDAKNRDALLCQGRVLGAQGNHAQALNAFEQALSVSKDPFELIIAHLFIGNLHKENKQYAAAIASYNKSLAISVQEKNQKFTHINYNALGETYALNNDLKSAISNYQAGLKEAMNENERVDSREKLAAAYSATGQHDLAIEHQIKATLEQERAGTLDQLANARMELGRIYIAAKEYKNAERTYAKLVQFAKDNGGAYYEAKANIGLAQTKAIVGDKAAAKTILADSERIAKTLDDAELIAEVQTSMNQINAQK